jgi:hypothetical protein
MTKVFTNVIMAACLLLVLGSCNNAQKSQTNANQFGEAFAAENVQSIDDMFAQMAQDKTTEMEAKVEGKVTGVCQKKGCWMTLAKADGSEMMVRFKDYGFFMPTDIAGKTVVIDGIAKVDTTSVDEQRHYAEDAGKDAAEIAKITEPEVAVSFTADGVIIKE